MPFKIKTLCGCISYAAKFIFNARFHLIVTPAGAAVLFISLFILIRSLVMRNSYEIVLSSAVLLSMLIMGITGAWKSRKLKTMEPAWKPPFPLTASFNNTLNEEKTQVTGIDAAIPLFFRMHFFVRGRFFLCGEQNKSCSVSAETSVQRGETSAQLTLDFSMSGMFQGDGYCKLRDIFGLFSFSCGQPQRRTLNVRSAPCFGKQIPVSAQSGAEDRRHKQSQDEERYYMREYTPGDRLRDINWKSSDRINTLITRISTDNQEKISRLEVHLRNFLSADKEKKIPLEALWLLDRAKARLAYFLRTIKEQNSSFVFDVRCAQGTWEIEDDADLDAFLEELGAFSFLPPQNETLDVIQKTGELYVFSTSCDIGLPGFLLTQNQRQVNLFLTANRHEPSRNKDKISNNKFVSVLDSSRLDNELLRFGDFASKGCGAPFSWFAGGKVKPLSVHANKMEINYAEIKL